MFEYFYNEVFRSVIIGFGSLFNDVQVRHNNSSGGVESVVKVPLSYGPTQKFLARMQQEKDLNRPVQMTLPRMSFEFTNLEYDPTRKSSQVQTFVVKNEDGTKANRGFLPVPYNMTITLSIMTKLNDDMLQIVEQILPYFQPAYILPIKFLSDVKEKRDIPIQLVDIQMEDDYEGNFDTRRALIYTLTFNAKTQVFGPVTDVSGEIIKKVSVGYIGGGRSASDTAVRDLTYTVTPRAVKDYDGSVVALLDEDVDMIETVIDVTDGTVFTENTYIYIDQEEMYVETVSGNRIKVRRAQDNTTHANHVKGAQIMSITTSDNNLIEFGDDFGFDGNIS